MTRAEQARRAQVLWPAARDLVRATDTMVLLGTVQQAQIRARAAGLPCSSTWIAPRTSDVSRLDDAVQRWDAARAVVEVMTS